MGILDDAIREHLELRRRGGASAEEIHKLEQSLLSGDGPADEPEAAAAEHAAEPEPAAAEPEADPEPVAEPAPPAAEIEPVEQPTRQFTAAERDAAERPDPEPPKASDDTAGEEDHDELEDTPEFLQETPEHDRLWFEQKPPKDFDF